MADVLTTGARCAMPARQVTHFVNDFLFRLVGQHSRPVHTRGCGREFDLVRCKATLTELKVTLHSVPLSLNSPCHLRTWLVAYPMLGNAGGLAVVICAALIALFSSPR